MSDYKELVEELRSRDIEDRYKRLTLDAADAIERLCERPSMSDYTELVKALRRCDMKQGCFNANCRYSVGKYFCDMDKVHKDAAAAIEALNRLLDQNTQRCEALRKQLRESHENYEKHLNELEAQLPKRGEWVEENRRPRSSQFVCSECHRTAYDPQPTRDKAWRKRCRYAYCPNCGAKMTEVQE